MSNNDNNIEKRSFEAFVNAIGSEIEQAQVRLISAANAQMLFHYWKMGNYILYHQNWKSHATLTPLAKQNLPTFGYNMIDPLKSWCWGSILFYPFKISRFS